MVFFIVIELDQEQFDVLLEIKYIFIIKKLLVHSRDHTWLDP